jgi:hypothetical protein
MASGYVIGRGADTSVQAFVVTAVTVFVVLRTNLHPLWLMLGAAVLSIVGLL